MGDQDQGRKGEEGQQGACDGDGCDAEVIVCATNRLFGPGDSAKVNFTFEVGRSGHVSAKRARRQGNMMKRGVWGAPGLA